MMEGMNHIWGFGMGFGWIFMILFWILVVIGIVALVKWVFNASHKTKKMPPHEKPPLEILKERYARGEIDKKEFEEKKHDLQD